MPYEPTTNFRDSHDVDLGKKLVTKDYLLSVYETILESSGATGLVVTPELWIWGRNNAGQLGDNTSIDKGNPITTFAGGRNWKQISCRQNHTAAIKTDGSLWTWGQNNRGQLGINDATNRSTPVTTFVGGNDWKSVAVGTDSMAAVKTDGTLWTWGAGTNGQLGNNQNASDRSTPVTTITGGTNWKSVAVGYRYVGAIKTDGTLWVWGANYAGNLGIDNAFRQNAPVTTFAGGTDWKQVVCGRFHMGAIKTDGSLWTWGNGASGVAEGVLGNNEAGVAKSTPVTTFAGGNDWKQISSGLDRIAAIKTDGSLWVWGRNDSQLGINATGQRSTPVTTFAGGNNWKSVSAGTEIMGIKTDGTLWVLGVTPVTTILGGNNWKSAAAGNTGNDQNIHRAVIQSNDYI